MIRLATEGKPLIANLNETLNDLRSQVNRIEVIIETIEKGVREGNLVKIDSTTQEVVSETPVWTVHNTTNNVIFKIIEYEEGYQYDLPRGEKSEVFKTSDEAINSAQNLGGIDLRTKNEIIGAQVDAHNAQNNS